MSNKRIRDPIHDLIEFDSTELERVLWEVVDSRPFQRLRRVKQLGFSDFVYPGAAHSRFAHSLGVFHTARQLMQIIHSQVSIEQSSKEQRALAAALVHDLGHGPFSHAFEKVGSRLGLKLADHENMSDALIRDSEVTLILNQLGSGFANDVADIIQKDGVKSVEHAVVSSQFDADRLDYIRRDRMMSGSRHAAIDFRWLISNLEVGSVSAGMDDTPLDDVETFVLSPKAIHAAEAFVLGLFQLYPTVYFHKATRGAEKLFTELMVRIVTLVRDGHQAKTGLPVQHALVKFAENPESLEIALQLDDSLIWGALSQLAESSDEIIVQFSTRLRDRQLFKCKDIRVQVSSALDPKSTNSDELIEKIDRCCAAINQQLTDWVANESIDFPRVLLDMDERSPYKSVGQSKGPLDRINVRTEGGELVDLRDRSSVVAALKSFKMFRAYTSSDDNSTKDCIERIVEGEIQKCRN